MALRTVGLQTAVWNNNLRSILLLGSYPVLMIALLWAVGAAFGAIYGGSAGRADLVWPLASRFGLHAVIAWWPAMLSAVAIWFLIAFFFHTRMIRSLSHSRPVTRKEEPALYNLLENLCISRGLTMPRLEIIETDALNAYASGIDKRSYSITVTRGLMQRLEADELEAVLGHELTHITNRDVRLLIVSIIFTGMIGFASQLVWSHIRFALYANAGGRDRRDFRLVLIVAAVGVILWIGYMATIFTRFALSRRREYMADAGAVQLTRNPSAMMRALMKISGRDRIPGAPDDIALMCIENSSALMGLFATHPPIADRIAAIAANTGEPIPEIAAPSRPESQSRNPWQRREKPGRNPWM